MARPNKEGMDYFSHDTDACSDEKIEVLRTLYGNDGYAFYFIMLERIYRSNSFQIDVSDAETREETIQILSKKVLVSQEKFVQMLNTALKWGCFDKELYEREGLITSNGIKKRASTVVNKRKLMKEKYDNSKRVSDAETREETMSETPQSKVKESKEKKSKENKKDIIGDYTANENLKEAIKDFSAMRTKLKKPLTDKALSLILKKLDDLSDNDAMKIAILNQSIEHSWQGVFELKDTGMYKGDVLKNGGNRGNTEQTFKYKDATEYTGPIYDDSEFI